jgi:hypothetical protein
MSKASGWELNWEEWSIWTHWGKVTFYHPFKSRSMIDDRILLPFWWCHDRHDVCHSHSKSRLHKWNNLQWNTDAKVMTISDPNWSQAWDPLCLRVVWLWCVRENLITMLALWIHCDCDCNWGWDWACPQHLRYLMCDMEWRIKPIGRSALQTRARVQEKARSGDFQARFSPNRANDFSTGLGSLWGIRHSKTPETGRRVAGQLPDGQERYNGPECGTDREDGWEGLGNSHQLKDGWNWWHQSMKSGRTKLQQESPY